MLSVCFYTSLLKCVSFESMTASALSLHGDVAVLSNRFINDKSMCGLDELKLPRKGFLLAKTNAPSKTI